MLRSRRAEKRILISPCSLRLNLLRKVIRLNPVEIQYDMQSDEAKQYSAAGFVEDTKRLERETIAKYYRYRLIDKEHQQNRIQNFKNSIPFHNQSLEKLNVKISAANF